MRRKRKRRKSKRIVLFLMGRKRMRTVIVFLRQILRRAKKRRLLSRRRMKRGRLSKKRKNLIVGIISMRQGESLRRKLRRKVYKRTGTERIPGKKTCSKSEWETTGIKWSGCWLLRGNYFCFCWQ